MAVRKQRATTSKTAEMDIDKSKVITFGKRYHRYDKEFYIHKINTHYVTVNKFNYDTSYQNETNIEHWIFDETKNRWKVEGECI